MNKVWFALIFCLIGISESCFSSYNRAMDRLNCPEKHDVWLSGKLKNYSFMYFKLIKITCQKTKKSVEYLVIRNWT